MCKRVVGASCLPFLCATGGQDARPTRRVPPCRVVLASLSCPGRPGHLLEAVWGDRLGVVNRVPLGARSWAHEDPHTRAPCKCLLQRMITGQTLGRPVWRGSCAANPRPVSHPQVRASWTREPSNRLPPGSFFASRARDAAWFRGRVEAVVVDGGFYRGATGHVCAHRVGRQQAGWVEQSETHRYKTNDIRWWDALCLSHPACLLLIGHASTPRPAA